MRIFVGRPVLTRRVAYTIYYMPLFLVLWGLLAWVDMPHTDAAKYRAYQRGIARWDSTTHSDSLKLDKLTAAIRDSAERVLTRLTSEQVQAQHAAYGNVIFAPQAMLDEQAGLRDRMAWSARQAQRARSALYNWLNDNRNEGRDTLGVRRP